jgi:hypothetical protein
VAAAAAAAPSSPALPRALAVRSPCRASHTPHCLIVACARLWGGQRVRGCRVGMCLLACCTAGRCVHVRWQRIGVKTAASKSTSPHAGHAPGKAIVAFAPECVHLLVRPSVRTAAAADAAAAAAGGGCAARGSTCPANQLVQAAADTSAAVAAAGAGSAACTAAAARGPSAAAAAAAAALEAVVPSSSSRCRCHDCGC